MYFFYSDTKNLHALRWDSFTLFYFDLHPRSIKQLCAEVSKACEGDVDRYGNFLNMYSLYLARHGLYVEVETL